MAPGAPVEGHFGPLPGSDRVYDESSRAQCSVLDRARDVSGASVGRRRQGKVQTTG